MSPRSRIPIWPSRSISRHHCQPARHLRREGRGEVWRFDGETLTIERLGPDGRYEEVAASTFLSVLPDEVATGLKSQAKDTERYACLERLSAWLRNEWKKPS